MTSNYSISHYLNAKDNKGTQIQVLTALMQIRDGILKREIQAIRSEIDKKKRSALKMKLPAVTWSGLFNDGRAKDKITEHSGLVVLDFDGLEDKSELRAIIATVNLDERVFASFISPSGNGFKVIVKVEINSISADQHEFFWSALAEYFLVTYEISADESGKDCSRLCFLSADADTHLFPTSNELKQSEAQFLFDKRTARIAGESAAKKVKTSRAPTPVLMTDGDMLIAVQKFTNNKSTYQEHNENNYIYLFASNANRKGIPEFETLTFLKSNYDHDPKRIESAVNSAYKNHTDEHGKYAKKIIPDYLNVEKKEKKAVSEDSEYDDSSKFWYESANDKTGSLEYKFSYDDCITFLTRNGFYKYKLDDKYQLIHVKGKFIAIVTETRIREFIFKFLKSEGDELKGVREMMRRGAKTYLSGHLFEQLDYFEPLLKRDDKDNCFIYFKNCFLQVTGEAVAKMEYHLLDGYIWEKQIIDFNYQQSEHTDGDFYKFISLSMNGWLLGSDGPLFMQPEDKREVPDDEFTSGLTRLKAIGSGIGYMLHGWKDPSNCKALVAADRNKSKNGEPNGRTGKSLLAKALAKMSSTCLIDGPNFKFDKDFAFQKANVDTKIINFNDVTKHFDFNKLFGMITEEFSFEKKRMDAVTIPFKDSPKFYISTNFTLKGDGESNIGRQFIVEFGSYFTSTKTPVSVFGKRFFDEWDEMEFCRFYSFMLTCIKMYLRDGLIDFPLDSYKERKLEAMAGPDFIVMMDESIWFTDGAIRSNEIKKSDLFQKYRTVSGLDKTTPNSFKKFVDAYADLKDYTINNHGSAGPGSRIRRDGDDYLTFYKTVI